MISFYLRYLNSNAGDEDKDDSASERGSNESLFQDNWKLFSL